MSSTSSPAKFVTWARQFCAKENHAWDQPTKLIFLRTRPMGDIVEKEVHTAKEHYDTLVKMTITKMVADFRERDDESPWEFDAIALVNEGWAPPESMVSEIHRRTQAGGSVGRFEDIAGSTEIRMVSVVGADGMWVSLGWTRDQPEPKYVLSSDENGHGFRGPVFEVLRTAWEIKENLSRAAAMNIFEQ